MCGVTQEAHRKLDESLRSLNGFSAANDLTDIARNGREATIDHDEVTKDMRKMRKSSEEAKKISKDFAQHVKRNNVNEGNFDKYYDQHIRSGHAALRILWVELAEATLK